jgi:hypothetical protein
VIWAAICGWGLPLLSAGPRAQGAMLVLGLAALLLENTHRVSGRVGRGE